MAQYTTFSRPPHSGDLETGIYQSHIPAPQTSGYSWALMAGALAFFAASMAYLPSTKLFSATSTKATVAPQLVTTQSRLTAQMQFSQNLMAAPEEPASEVASVALTSPQTSFVMPAALLSLGGVLLAMMAIKRPAESIAMAATISAKDVQALRQESGAGMMDCKKALMENDGDFQKAAEWLRKKGITSADKKAARVAAEGVVSQYIHMGSRIGVLIEVNCETDFVARGEVFQNLVKDLAMQVAACESVTVVSTEDVDPAWLAKEREIELGKEDLKSKPEAIRVKMVDGRMQKLVKEKALLEQPFIKDQNKLVSEVVKEAIAAVGENIKVRRFTKFVLGEGLEKRQDNFAEEVAAQTAAAAAAAQKAAAAPAPAPAPAKEEKAADEVPAVQISAKAVSELRRKSGAGMMDCKKALAQNNNDIEAAADWLRKKGLVSADKKAGRIAAEGLIGSYIHMGSRLGVLIEVNCETDFVARGDTFKQLVQDLAMQVAACEAVNVVSVDDVDPAWLDNERRVEMEKEDLRSKPEQIRSKIVDGRMQKRVKEVALLEQPFIKDQDKTVGEVLKTAVATIGENIKVRRFSKFVLGEGIAKRVDDFAAEVAAVTGKA